jgi:hypothetical protein
MDFTNELNAVIGQGLLALLAMIWTIFVGQIVRHVPIAVDLWNQATKHKIVQDAILWAAKEAVARLRNSDDNIVVTEEDAVDQAAIALTGRVPEALYSVGLSSPHAIKDRVAARVRDLLWNQGQ